ncbi:MAG: T9SS type A sorting domain-containing protein [Aestuariibaculum sp.]
MKQYLLFSLAIVTGLFNSNQTCMAWNTNPYLTENYAPAIIADDALLDRTAWTITTSIEGASDTAVGGDDPNNIIDGPTQTCFLFVKPGKTYGGIAAPANYIPSFTIDMQTAQTFDYFVYRHRTFENTTEFLRAKKVSFYGKNTETESFTLIVENAELPTASDVSEVRIDFSEVTYRYVQLVIEEWSSSYSTIQVSEFNIGKSAPLSISDLEGGQSLVLQAYPNPVNSGQDLVLTTSNKLNDVELEVFDILGKQIQTSTQLMVKTQGIPSGIYFVRIHEKSTGRKAVTKFIIK